MQHRAHLYLDSILVDKLDVIAKEISFKNRPETFAYILKKYEDSRQNNDLKAATFEAIMSVQAPVCITGLPGSGKTSSLHAFLKECKEKKFNIFLIDSALGEAKNLGQKISTLRALAFNPRDGIYRFEPEQDPRMRRFTMRRLFERLAMLQMKQKLQGWIIAIDEANQFADIEQLRSFVIESRKFCRKVVLVSADTALYEGLCVMMKPKEKASGNTGN